MKLPELSRRRNRSVIDDGVVTTKQARKDLALPRSVAREAMRQHYSDGLKDGIRMTLDHLEGLEAGGAPYRGPMPDELRAYITRVRSMLDDASIEKPGRR